MRLIVLCACFLLASCATPPKVVTEIKTVDRVVSVREACIKASEIPSKPERVVKPEQDVRGLAASAVAELRAWEAYYLRADALMRGCI